MSATQVSLSSGETFFVDAPPHRVEKALDGGVFVRIGGRIVNSLQVVQLTVAREIPSIYTPEPLED